MKSINRPIVALIYSVLGIKKSVNIYTRVYLE